MGISVDKKVDFTVKTHQFLPDNVRFEKFFSKYWLFVDACKNSHKSAAVGGGDAGEHCDAHETGLKLKLVLDVGVSIPRSLCLLIFEQSAILGSKRDLAKKYN